MTREKATLEALRLSRFQGGTVVFVVHDVGLCATENPEDGYFPIRERDYSNDPLYATIRGEDVVCECYNGKVAQEYWRKVDGC